MKGGKLLGQSNYVKLNKINWSSVKFNVQNYHLIVSITTNNWNTNVWLFCIDKNGLGITFQKSNVTERYEDCSTFSLLRVTK